MMRPTWAGCAAVGSVAFFVGLYCGNAPFDAQRGTEGRVGGAVEPFEAYEDGSGRITLPDGRVVTFCATATECDGAPAVTVCPDGSEPYRDDDTGNGDRGEPVCPS